MIFYFPKGFFTDFSYTGVAHATSHIKPSECDSTSNSGTKISIMEVGMRLWIRTGDFKKEFLKAQKILQIYTCIWSYLVALCPHPCTPSTYSDTPTYIQEGMCGVCMKRLIKTGHLDCHYLRTRNVLNNSNLSWKSYFPRNNNNNKKNGS